VTNIESPTSEIKSTADQSNNVIPFDVAGPQRAAKFIADMFGATTEKPVHV
jgi:hypothetical protein